VATCISLPRVQDEIWLVSSRSLGCGAAMAGKPRLLYWKNDKSRGWVRTSHAAWLAGDPTAHVSISIHGNDISAQRAVDYGWAVYADLVRSAPEQPPVRFVIYSWPSDKVRALPAENVRIKCARSDVDARYLAWFIDQLPPQTPLSIAGYSLGAWIVGGALELTGGGSLNGRPMESPLHRHRDPARVVLMAAAINNDWLLPGRRFGLAISQMEHLTLINNTCDRVLRFYHRIYCRRGGPEALGSTGFPCPAWLGEQRNKLSEYDACCLIGPEHNWEHYTGSPTIANWIGRGLLFTNFAPTPHELAAAQSESSPEPIPTADASYHADAVLAGTID
jgi:hypothetical protein